MKTWVTKELANYAVKTKFEDYPRDVIDWAKLLILDNIGCMLGGCKTDLGKAIVTPIKNMGGAEEATLVGVGVKVPTIQAAFVNGTTANALDYDDTDVGHAGSSIIPSALAMAEWKHASGKDLINGVVMGYEIGNRVGKATWPSYERCRNVWGLGTWQTFSSVAAAAKVLNLDLDRMLNAFGVAGATAPVPNIQKWGWDIEERPIHWAKEPTGWPAWTGTTAAVLAANGFVGNRYILDGDNGFWIMAGSDRCDFDEMTRGLGTEYEVHNVGIKPYPCCRWPHPALDCVRELKAEYDLNPEEIKEVVIHSYSWMKRLEVQGYRPKDMVDAEFCARYTVAMVLMGYQPGPAWYTEENLKSEDILNLSKKVRVELDPDINRVYWDKFQFSTRVEIINQRGQKFEKFVEWPTGNPHNPLSMEQIEDKFRNQAAYSLRGEEIETAIQKIHDLENINDLTDLMSTLAGR